MEVLMQRAIDELPVAFGVPSTRRTRRVSPPARSVGYFSSAPSVPTSRPRSRAGTHSRSNSITSPSSDSSVLSASARSSAEFCALPARPAPVLPELPDLLLPESESEPLTDLDDDPRPRVSVLGQRCCAIEGDEFRAGESVARLPCGCVFHRDCIVPFIFRARHGGYCPLDGTPVPRVHAALLPVWAIPYPPHGETGPLVPDLSPQPPNSAPPPTPEESTPTPPEPTLPIPEKWAPTQRQTCAIDGARFAPGESCVRLRSCGHVFHAKCATAYLAREHHPCCPLDGRSVGPTDIHPVFVASTSRGISRDTRQPRPVTDPRVRDARVRRALRALIKAAAACTEVAPQEAEAPLHVRATCSAERATSVRRRRSALGDPPTAPDVQFDSCAADEERFQPDDDLIALECGHAFHANCAHRGCGCDSGLTGAAMAGVAAELLPVLADRDARRWRCAELAALAREKTRIRSLDATGDARAALEVAERAALEVRASLRLRRAALAGATSWSTPQSSRFVMDPDRRRSMPDQRSYSFRNAAPPQMNLLHSRSMGRRIGETSALRRGTSFARLPRPFRGSPRTASPSPPDLPRMSSTLSEPARDGTVRTASAWARRVARHRDTELLATETPVRAHSDVPPRSPFSMFLAPDVPVVLRVPSSLRPSRSGRRRRRENNATAEEREQGGMVRVESVSELAVDGNLSAECEHGVDVCVIDLEEFKTGDVLVRLPCMHSFHQECILPYLRQQERPSCPIDRTPVEKEQIDELPVWEKK